MYALVQLACSLTLYALGVFLTFTLAEERVILDAPVGIHAERVPRVRRVSFRAKRGI